MMSTVPQIKILVGLFFLIFTSIYALRLKERNGKCGYRVYLSNASWYKAYDICDQNKKVLALPESDLSSLIIVLNDLLSYVSKFIQKSSFNTGFWIGAFMRTSTNKAMNFRCKLLNNGHHENQSPSTEDILCLYYNFSEQKVLAESCNSTKSFICMSPNSGEFDCAINSSVNNLKNSGQYVLYQDTPDEIKDEQSCTETFLNRAKSYAMYFDSSICRTYTYSYTTLKIPLGGNFTDIKYKSFFMILDSPPVSSLLKPLSEWCPVIEIQEGIETRKKDLAVDRKTTSKYQRTLISAPDDRPSSKYMGVTGALIISLVAGLIVCIDLANFCKKLKPVRVKIE